jgi:chromosome segregation ATPase
MQDKDKELEQMQEEMEAKEIQVRKLETQNTELTEKGKENTTRVEELQIRVLQTENDIQRMRESMSETIAKQESQLEGNQRTIERLTSEKEKEIEQMRNENDVLKQANARLNQDSGLQSSQIQSLTQQVSELNQTVESQQAQLQASIDNLTAEKKEHAQQTSREKAELQESTEGLRKENEGLLARNQSLEQQAMEVKETLESQKSMLRDKEQSIQILTTENEEKIQNLTAENAELKQKKLALERNNEDHTAHIRSLQQQATELGQTMKSQEVQFQSSFERVAAEKEEQIQQLNREKAELQTSTLGLRHEKERLSEQNQRLEQEAEELKETVRNQESVIHNQEQTITLLTTENENQTREKAELRQTEAVLEQQSEEQLTHIRSLRREAAELSETAKRQETQLQASIDSLTAEKEELIQQMNREKAELEEMALMLRQETEGLLAHNRSLEQQTVELQETVRNQKSVLGDKEQENDILKTEHAEQVQNLTRENAKLRQSEVDLRKQTEEQLVHIKSLRLQISELGQAVNGKKAQLQDQQQTIDSLNAGKRKEIEDLTREMNEMKEAAVELKREKEQMSAQIQSLHQQATKVHQTVESQRVQLYNKQSVIDNLTANEHKQIEGLVKENNELRQEITELEQENKEMSRRMQSLQQQAAEFRQTVEHQDLELLEKHHTIANVTADKQKKFEVMARDNAELRKVNIGLKPKTEEMSTHVQSLATECDQSFTFLRTELQKEVAMDMSAKETDKHIDDWSEEGAKLTRQNDEMFGQSQDAKDEHTQQLCRENAPCITSDTAQRHRPYGDTDVSPDGAGTAMILETGKQQTVEFQSFQDSSSVFEGAVPVVLLKSYGKPVMPAEVILDTGKSLEEPSGMVSVGYENKINAAQLPGTLSAAERLRKHSNEAIEELQARYFVDELYAKKVFSEEDKEMVNELEGQRLKQARKFMEIMATKGEEKIEMFFHILKTTPEDKQPHLYKIFFPEAECHHRGSASQNGIPECPTVSVAERNQTLDVEVTREQLMEVDIDIYLVPLVHACMHSQSHATSRNTTTDLHLSNSANIKLFWFYKVARVGKSKWRIIGENLGYSYVDLQQYEGEQNCLFAVLSDWASNVDYPAARIVLEACEKAEMGNPVKQILGIQGKLPLR